MLAPYRVLDLTDSRASLGPMILADLGADVIRVEPPGGSADRAETPSVPGAPDGMGSVRFHVYNRNKRSVAVDVENAGGRAQFLELVKGADFVFENAGPGAMAAKGLGFDDLAKANPGLVYVAVSPFGQEGPYAAHRTTDLTLAAMGGMMALNGDADRAPLRITVPQTWLHAAAESAAAALIAHWRRLQTGEGQFVDVSVQASVFWTGLNAMIAAAVHKDIERAGTLLQLGVIDLPLVYAAADGEAVLVATGATMVPLARKVVEDGTAPAEFATDEDWKTYDIRLLTGQPVKYGVADVIQTIAAWAKTRTKAEMLSWGLANGVTIAPVTTVADVLGIDQLEKRDFWHPYEFAAGKTANIPGPFVKASASPIMIGRTAPAAGEHNVEVLGQTRAPVSFATLGGRTPFEGLRVADFSWIGVGPITAKYFADHGATTVRVETSNPPDRLRGAGPHKDGIPGPNRSQFFASFNTSKKGILLDLKQPGGQQVAKQLLAWCDVAFESFTPGTMADLGLDYEAARALNRSIIMVSTCLMGQTGPAARLAGYGYHAAAISGFYEVTGWPDRPPAGPFNAYTDVIAPHFLATAVAAALDHRRRTGEGQYIDQAQMESALQFLATELADYQLNGTVPRRAGNDDLAMAPHNAYPTAGADQWIAIAVEDDECWRTFRALMGEPEWAADPALDTAPGRLAARRQIDEKVGAWTAPQERFALMNRLQAAGIAAGAVQRSSDLLNDPQLAHRRFFHPLTHTEMGEVPYEGPMFAIRGYDGGPRFAAPCLGEHTFEVLTDNLGMEPEAAAEAMALGGVGG